jgi:arylsulfatase A-like enzyme
MGGDTAALCVPARAALLTGRSVYQVLKGSEMWGPPLDPSAPLLPERFRRAGWPASEVAWLFDVQPEQVAA